MDLGPTRKPLELGGISAKKIAFFVVAGVVLVVGIGIRASHYLSEQAGREKAPVAVEAQPSEPAAPQTATPTAAETIAKPVPKTSPATQEAATAPSKPVEQAGDAAEQTKPKGDAAKQAGQAKQAGPALPGADMILVARKPVELLASPSASATVMFGFPAGRPFRVIGEEGGFAHIRDLKSGTTGWIDKAALAPPPRRAPAATARSRATPAARGRKSPTASAGRARATEKDTSSVADESAPPPQPRKRGLFGGDGLFGGLFGKAN